MTTVDSGGLDEPQRARIAALHEAREVLKSVSFGGGTSVPSEDAVVFVAHWIITGAVPDAVPRAEVVRDMAALQRLIDRLTDQVVELALDDEGRDEAGPE